MANPTTNYGFVLPTATDLVTDLPADFDVALQGVDTRLKALQPGTTLGDLFYASATANTNTRLGVGTNGQVLSVSSGVPAWTTTSDVTPLTTKGDLFTFTTVDARLGIGANNTVLTADSAEATGMKWATPAGGGKVLQVINVRANTETSTSSSTLSSMGLSATITPSSASSKVLILASVNGIKKFTGNAAAQIRLNRAGSALFDLELNAGKTDGTVNNDVAGTSTSYLDSPATTSATTYDITIAARGSVNGIMVNDGNSSSTITLLEIGA